MKELTQHIEQIAAICNATNVKKLYAFGSAITDKLNPKSDIDLIVEIEDQEPLAYANNYFKLKFQLEKLLHRKIDLLEEIAIINQNFKQEIEKTKVLVYEK